VAIEIPFMSTSIYTGPVVAALGGADISWILGLILSAGLFYALMAPHRRRVREVAVPELTVPLGDPDPVP
jgi:NCS1 family nucleobase:cation symporter-1